MGALIRTRMGGLALGAGVLVGCGGVRLVPDSVGNAAAEASTVPLEVRLWEAGRPIAPGLANARMAELAAERERAVRRLSAGLTRADEARVRDWLASLETPDDLWCAAARATAAMERYEWAPALAGALQPGSPALRAMAAREALHGLYGRWFRNASEVEPYAEAIERGAGTRLLLDGLGNEEARSRERLLAELEHRPTAAIPWLTDPDPLVRSGAARVLEQVFAHEGEDATGTLAALLSHLEGELDPAAFHAGLEACILPLERMQVDQPLSARFRSLLIDLARGPCEPRTLSVAQALARIPWRMNGPRDLGHVLSGIEALGAMLRALSEADRRRGVNDPDPLVGVLAALRQLSTLASSNGLGRELRGGPASESLFAVLQDPLQAEAVRAAAAAALGSAARLTDGERLGRVLADPGVGAQVKHALLGALGEILPELQGSSPGAHELLEAVANLCSAPDADLRRRALSLCDEPRLEALMRGLDPAFLVRQLGREEGREATLVLLRLLQRLGRPEMLADVLALERFEHLCAEPASLDALALVLGRFTRGQGRGAMQAALRLADVQAEATSLSRLRHALALVASLDQASAYALEASEHRAILTWVSRALRSGIAARDLVPEGLVFEQRLLSVHLPRCGSGEEPALQPFEFLHLVALLRADLFLGAAASSGRGSKQEVEAAFESAQSIASDEEERFLVLRDRARFRAAANECVKALSDYRRLIEAGEGSEALLGIPDLRSAVELLGRMDSAGGAERPATAGEACALLERMIAREAWRNEPASVRMQDLRNWVRSALAAREPAALGTLEGALADLPLTQLETQEERAPVPLWFGLTREPGWFQELLDLRARVRLEQRELRSETGGAAESILNRP